MRFVGLACIVALTGTVAFAQQGGGDKGKAPPRPPPPPRVCADLSIGSYTIVNAATEGDQISVAWEVRNAGGRPYQAQSSADQAMALEIRTPGGPQQIASATLPPDSAAGLTLAPGASWRGVISGALTPEARRRPLWLRLAYAPVRGALNDCDTANNAVEIRTR